jgi:hypothetical protein
LPLVPLLPLAPESTGPVQQTFAHWPVSCAGWTQWSVLFSVCPVMPHEHWQVLSPPALMHVSLATTAPDVPEVPPEVPDVPEVPDDPDVPESAVVPDVPVSLLLLHAPPSAATEAAATVRETKTRECFIDTSGAAS